MARNNKTNRSLGRSASWAVAALALLGHGPALGNTTTLAIDKADSIRERMLESGARGRAVPAGDAPRLAQYWGNFPNWPNWGNWANWANWGGWVRRSRRFWRWPGH